MPSEPSTTAAKGLKVPLLVAKDHTSWRFVNVLALTPDTVPDKASPVTSNKPWQKLPDIFMRYALNSCAEGAQSAQNANSQWPNEKAGTGRARRMPFKYAR